MENIESLSKSPNILIQNSATAVMWKTVWQGFGATFHHVLGSQYKLRLGAVMRHHLHLTQIKIFF